MVGRLIAAESAPAKTLNSRHTNGNVPPASTIAAQLVREHAAAGDGAPQVDASATFGQLLQEILSKPADPETDLAINDKLIRVVTEHGLNVLLQDNPFAQWDVLLPQARDSLAVIQSTIRRQPEVLLHDASHPAKIAQQPHLLLWLPPRLMSLASHRRCEPLLDSLQFALTCIGESLAKTLDLWQYANGVFAAFRDCVEDLCLASEGTFPELSVTVPPARSLKLLWSDTEQAVALPQGYQTEIKERQGAMCLAVLLLKALPSDQVYFDDLAQLKSTFASIRIQQRGMALRLLTVISTRRHWYDSHDCLSTSILSLLHLLKSPPSTVGHMEHEHSSQISGPLCQAITHLLSAQTKDILPTAVQKEVAKLAQEILNSSAPYCSTRVAQELFTPLMQALAANESSYTASIPALRSVVATWLLAYCPKVKQPDWLVTGPESDGGDVAMIDAGATAVHQEGPLPRLQPSPDHNPLKRKRRHIRAEGRSLDHDRRYNVVVNRIATLLRKRQVTDAMLGELHETASRCYSTLSAEERSVLLSNMAALPCLAAGMLAIGKCSSCDDNPRLDERRSANWSFAETYDKEHFLNILQQFLDDSELQKSSKERVAIMLAVRSFALHAGEHACLELESSRLGEFCLRSLQSSVRELRIAAGRTLGAFVRNGLPEYLRDRNRRIALDFLRTLSDRPSLGHHETLVPAWGQIANVCGERELNLALLRLVEYLGHTNTLICALAFNELQNIAQTLGLSPEELLQPFWRSIAVTVVQDLYSIPQKAQHLADLLAMSVNQFLYLTQTVTIPSLILTKKKEVLQRIASARGGNTTVRDICLQPRRNLAGILALLLAQPSSDPEGTVVAFLAEAAEGFQDCDLAGLVKLDPVLVACEMLKAAGDEDESKKPRVYQAIQNMAALAERRPGQSKTTMKPGRVLASFFETHILGMMTFFSNAVATSEDDRSSIRLHEKRRTLRAIEDMIRLAKTHVTAGLPQIRACLQSAIDQADLTDIAFSAWLSLISTLNGEDVVHLVDHTFALIVQHWDAFSPEIQQRTHDTIAEMLKTHSNLIREAVITIPSLKTIPLMSKFESEIGRLREHESLDSHLHAFAKRLRDENAAIVLQALEELVAWLDKHQGYLHEAAVSEQPKAVVAQIARALLDVCLKYNSDHMEILDLCGRCLGIVGCLDPNRVEANVSKRQILVLSDFHKADEVIAWVAVLFEDVLVRAFRSVTNARAQGFLAYAMQELLKFCGFCEVATVRLRASQSSPVYQRWIEMPENVRNTLTPFLSSRYALTSNLPTPAPRKYPLFSSSMSHSSWLRNWVCDMMWRAKGENPQELFPVLARIVRGHDIAIANYMLPYAALNIILGGTSQEVRDVSEELRVILSTDSTVESEKETLRQCSENVFAVLDYMSRWLQEKKRAFGVLRAAAQRAGHSPSEFDDSNELAQIRSVEKVISSIPADIIAQRAMECGSYARALFHWEHYMRERRDLDDSPRIRDSLYQRLQNIYAEIDEPDGLEGISAHLSILSPEQQAVQHRRAGRWPAAQSWYEIELSHKPSDPRLQVELLNCLRESGQYEQVLRLTDGYGVAGNPSLANQTSAVKLLSFAAEACWSTERIDDLAVRINIELPEGAADFNVQIGKALVALRDEDQATWHETLTHLRSSVMRTLTSASASSLQACHDTLLRLHVIHEMNALKDSSSPYGAFASTMDRRLAILGSYIADKQYLLSIRRAVMRLRPSQPKFSELDIGSSWLVTARLARKANVANTAHYAVLKATQCGDDGATIEHARLLWRDGQHRQAIKTLEGAISSNAFAMHDQRQEDHSNPEDTQQKQNTLSARAHLLHAKWLDASGQSQTRVVTQNYQYAAKNYNRWEKGHYYLGKHYNKLLEVERALPPGKQSNPYVTGEITKLVIENYVRSIPFGTKYWYQTIPKVITLWLDLGMETLNKPRGDAAEVFERRVRHLDLVHKQLRKYFDRMPPYILYTALPQMISRISHPNPKVYEVLHTFITRIVSTHPSQALWYLLAVAKSTSSERASRGASIINKLKDSKNRTKSDSASLDLRNMVVMGQKLSDALLQACEVHIESRASHVSLTKDLGFNTKLAPSSLVIPLESTLTASIPTVQDSGYIRKHVAFAQDKVTIASFSDDVLVLSSLQRPRKLTVRGSDGKMYGLLCKPKDDLRKDQRLMEFNAMINRAFKRDAETSKRRLYIKTYGVTPLSEESGTIEWVEGIKPLRDILLKLYQRKGIQPNYNELRMLLNEASVDQANVDIFTDKVLPTFPPILHEWFAEIFPEPDIWFAARLRYARSAAVMSMVGHVLGLGDRHGENILLEEGTGGVFHVDFNCLFDKGLTFEKPELVPFRLTHNMVDAMGAYGYEGPFRKSAELTLGLLRQHQDTLMTILETFLHDPTTDFIGKKKRTTPGVPETPQEVLDSVSSKLKGLLKGESVPLSVEGHVDALIAQAVDPWHLCRMYIGWCAFL